MDQLWLRIDGHVDECVKTDDRVERPVGERDLCGVGVQERGVGNELASAFDLDLAEIDAGDTVAVVGQRLGDGDSAAAAEIQHAGVGCVLGRVVVVAAVAV